MANAGIRGMNLLEYYESRKPKEKASIMTANQRHRRNNTIKEMNQDMSAVADYGSNAAGAGVRKGITTH